MAVETDAELIRASIGDPDLFGIIFDRHARTVVSYLTRRVGWVDGENLAAQVFADAFAARARFQPMHPTALPWLLGIASNKAANWARRNGRAQTALARVNLRNLDDDHAGRAVERADSDRIRPLLDEALGQLGDDDRETLLLHLWGQLSYRDVGLALEVPTGTVRSRINRAKRQLREALRSAGFQPETEVT